RGLVLIVLGMVLGLGAALLSLQALPTTYHVSSYVWVDLPLDAQPDAPKGATLLSPETVLAATVSEAKSPDVLALAARQPVGLTVEQFSAAVTVSVVPNTTLLEFRARARSSTVAVQLANTLADALVGYAATTLTTLQQRNQAQEQQLRSELAATQE